MTNAALVALWLIAAVIAHFKGYEFDAVAALGLNIFIFGLPAFVMGYFGLFGALASVRRRAHQHFAVSNFFNCRRQSDFKLAGSYSLCVLAPKSGHHKAHVRTRPPLASC